MPVYTRKMTEAEKKDMQTIVRRINDESRASGVDREIKKLQKEYKEVQQQGKGDSHDANNPDMGYGKEERMWKNHRWISRKRNKNGKWIYDYGYGYGVTKPELDRIKGEIDKKTLEASQLRSEARNPGKWEQDKEREKKTPILYITPAGEALDKLANSASQVIDAGRDFIKRHQIKL